MVKFFSFLLINLNLLVAKIENVYVKLIEVDVKDLLGLVGKKARFYF